MAVSEALLDGDGFGGRVTFVVGAVDGALLEADATSH